MGPETGYKDDILNQPAALRRTIDALEADASLRKRIEGLQGPAIQRIVLTGMGSSFYAPYPLHLRLTSALRPSWCIETSELLHYGRELLSAGTLVIAVSQSGRSAEVVRLVDMCSSEVPLVAVTNEPDSPLGLAATATIDIQAGSESTVSSKTYLASLAAIAWLGDLLLPGESRWFESVVPACHLLEEYLSTAEEHIEEIADSLRGVRNVFLTGRGYSLATCGTGALIMKESTRMPAQGLSSAAFRHGPFEMVSKESMVIVFEGDERTGGLNRKLAQDVVDAGGRSVLIGDGASQACFRLPRLSPTALPMTEILPVQLVTLAIARLGGFEAGVFRFASKVTTEE